MDARILGADPDQLDALAQTLSEDANSLDGFTAVLGGLLGECGWDGADSMEFRSDWDMSHVPAVATTAAVLRAMAANLAGQARDQRQASAATDGFAPGGGVGPFLASVPLRTPGSDYDEARREYFRTTEDGAQRQTERTDARTPGQGNGIIVARFFIPDYTAIPGLLVGDDRGYSTDPDAGYRIALAWNTETGEVSYTVSPSVKLEPHLDPGGLRRGMFGIPSVELPHIEWERGDTVDARPIVDGGANDVTFHQSGILPNGNAVVDVDYSGLNSVTPMFSTDGGIRLEVAPDGTITASVKGDDYPSVEVLQYRDGLPTRAIGSDDTNGWWNLPAGIPNHDRNTTWVLEPDDPGGF